MLGGTVLLLLVMSTGIVQWLSAMDGGFIVSTEDEPRALQFHEAFYFTVVTLSTVGFGDIAPASIYGRLLMTLIMLLFMYLVPYQTANFLMYNQMLSKYRGSYQPHGSRHIVVCCNVGCDVSKFLHEFFHKDHGVSNIQVVMLVPSEPTAAFKEIIFSYRRSDRRVKYLNGDLLSSSDLLRARIDCAVGCFILADQHACDYHAADAMTIMRTVSVHNYRPTLKTIVQLIAPENKQYLTSVGIPDHHIICINELRMSMAAQGCMLPGLTTIITNLTNSVSIDPDRIDEAHLREYAQGLEQEVNWLQPILRSIPSPT